MFTDDLQDLVTYYRENQDLATMEELYNELERRGYTGYERDLAYRYILNETTNPREEN